MSCKPSSKEKERTRSLQAVALDVFPPCRGCSFRSVTILRFGLKVSYSVIMCPECIRSSYPCYSFCSSFFLCLILELNTLRQILISLTPCNTLTKAICLTGITPNDTSMDEIRPWLITGSAHQLVLFLAHALVTANNNAAALNSGSSGYRSNIVLQIRKSSGLGNHYILWTKPGLSLVFFIHAFLVLPVDYKTYTNKANTKPNWISTWCLLGRKKAVISRLGHLVNAILQTQINAFYLSSGDGTAPLYMDPSPPPPPSITFCCVLHPNSQLTAVITLGSWDRRS